MSNKAIEISNQFVTVDKKQLFVQKLTVNKQSGKPVLVFLHEGLGCVEMWRDFPKEIVEATGLNAIVYDRQGYGKSSMLDLPRPVEYLEQEARCFLTQLLDKLKIKNPILVGHSDGGTIALIYAALNPVFALVTLAAHVYVEDVTLEGINAVVSRYNSVVTKKLEKYHGSKADAMYWAWADTWRRPAYKHWNIEHFLPAVNCPALILQGKNDEYATDEHVSRIVDGIKNKAQGFLIENCGHSPHIQTPRMTSNLIAQFIKKEILQQS